MTTNDSNNSNSNNNNNEPQIQAKKEMLRPLAKKKLQDHVKEYLNNYSKEMKMEKAVELDVSFQKNYDLI